MLELFQGYALSILDLCPAPANRSQFGLGGSFGGEAAVKSSQVGAQSLAHQFGTGAMLSQADPLKFLEHGGWQGNGHGLSGSHRCVLLMIYFAAHFRECY